MEEVKYGKIGFDILGYETKFEIMLEQVNISESNQLKIPNVSKTTRPMMYGRVIVTSIEDKFLQGKIIKMDPFRSIQELINNKTFFEISSGYSVREVIDLTKGSK